MTEEVIQKLHKITCLGELANPLYYNIETGELYRLRIYNANGSKNRISRLQKILCKSAKGYMYYKHNKKSYEVQLLIAKEFFPDYDVKKYVVDHIDGNPSNNALKNLQLLSHRENIAKGWASAKQTSLPSNVSWNKYRNKYILCITIEKQINFGSYDTVEAAVRARDEVMTRVVTNGESLSTFKSQYVTSKKYHLSSV